MSYILQALKKDKTNELAMDSGHNYIVHESKASQSGPILWGVLLTVAILGAVVIGYMLGRGGFDATKEPLSPPHRAVDNQQVAEVNEVKQTVNTASLVTPAVKRIAAEQYFETPPAVQSNDVSDGAKTAAVTEVESEPTIVGYQPEPVEKKSPDTFQVKAEEGVSEEMLALFKNALAETDVTLAQSSNESGNSGQDDIDVSMVKALSAMPQSFQQKIPSLNFTQHIYVTNNQGWVKVNGKDAKAGEFITDTVQLYSIEPQKVILQFQGNYFSLAAMSSW